MLTDKTLAYVENKNAGTWQNTVMFMGDDGNNNQHMYDANKAAGIVAELNPGILEKKRPGPGICAIRGVGENDNAVLHDLDGEVAPHHLSWRKTRDLREVRDDDDVVGVLAP